MRYAKPLTAMLLAAPLLMACAGSIQMVTPGVGCSTLIPAGWTEPVPSAAFPQDGADDRDWMAFGVEQTGQLVRANGRTSDVIEVVRGCEGRDAASVREITRPWYTRLLPG